MKLFLILFSLFFFSALKGQDIKNIIKEAGEYELSMNDTKALSKYKEALKIQPANIYLICKCSELSSMIGGRYKSDRIKMTDFYSAAKVYANRALKLNPKYSEANFVMSLVVGRTAMQKSGQEKIDAVRDIKKYAELAILYDPQNYKAWHILGKWFYEFSILNFFERSAVRIFYGPLPKGSINNAISAYERSKRLNPALLLNYLELAKAYKKNSEDHKAKLLLKTMLTLPLKTEDDPSIKTEGTVLLKKWS